VGANGCRCRSLLAQKNPGSKNSKQTIIDALKRAFELNPFDYMAADALALAYNVSGPGNAELVTLWQGRRDKAMSEISISMDCATKNNRLLGHACEQPSSAPAAPHTCVDLEACLNPFLLAILQSRRSTRGHSNLTSQAWEFGIPTWCECQV
jgi:hypothetical protein